MARNKYPEITVEKILDAAQRLFLEKGYDNTTIQDIVDELGGLTKGAVYHHFKSKEEIMDAVGDRMFRENNPFEMCIRDRSWLAAQTGDAFNLLDAFTGGSLASMSIFALGINPYITSSIIIQLLTLSLIHI